MEKHYEREKSGLFKSVVFLATALDVELFADAAVQPVGLLQIMDALSTHESTYLRSYSPNLKLYILSTLLDHHILSLQQTQPTTLPANFSTVLDNIEMQYHRQHYLYESELGDRNLGELFEELDEQKQGYLTAQQLTSVIESYDQQHKVKITFNNIRNKLCNNLHDGSPPTDVFGLENFVELVRRVDGHGKSEVYALLDHHVRQVKERQYKQEMECLIDVEKRHRSNCNSELFYTKMNHVKGIALQQLLHPTLPSFPCKSVKEAEPFTHTYTDKKQPQVQQTWTYKTHKHRPSSTVGKQNIEEVEGKKWEQTVRKYKGKGISKLERRGIILSEIERLEGMRKEIRGKLYEYIGI